MRSTSDPQRTCSVKAPCYERHRTDRPSRDRNWKRVGWALLFLGGVFAAGNAVHVHARWTATAVPTSRTASSRRRSPGWAHAMGGAVAALIGPFQLITRLRTSWPRVHVWMGRTYLARGARRRARRVVLRADEHGRARRQRRVHDAGGVLALQRRAGVLRDPARQRAGASPLDAAQLCTDVRSGDPAHRAAAADDCAA